MKQQNHPTTTRNDLLDAAGKIILKNGIEALTLEAIAREAGVSKGGLLYHFPSKKKLIQAMIARHIEVIDACLAEELKNSKGNFIEAYIRASFIPQTDQNRVSSALVAATSHDPDLVEPLRDRFYKMQREITAAAVSPELGTLIRLALDGMWFAELFGFAPPEPALRAKMKATLLKIAGIEEIASPNNV